MYICLYTCVGMHAYICERKTHAMKKLKTNTTKGVQNSCNISQGKALVYKIPQHKILVLLYNEIYQLHCCELVVCLTLG